MKINPDRSLHLDKEEYDRVKRIAAETGRTNEQVVAWLYEDAFRHAARERRYRRALADAGFSRTD